MSSEMLLSCVCV